MVSEVSDDIANSIDPDQTAQKQSDQSLYCLLRPSVPISFVAMVTRI